MRWALLFCSVMLGAQPYDLVLRGGRVMDPETGLDAVREVGIRGGRIAAITADRLSGRQTLDVTGLVVAPGFIDLHVHTPSPEMFRAKALDGVTTALELEIGVWPVDRWYREREGKSLIHFGASAGHLGALMQAMGDDSPFLPGGRTAKEAAASGEHAAALRHLREALKEGGLGIGMGIAYIPMSTRTEILDVFRLAAESKRPVFVHMRHPGRRDPGVIDSLQEMIANAAATGAAVHVVHINSMANQALPQALEMIDAARVRGLDITTETYPYTAGNTRLESAIFAPGWQQKLEISYQDLMWVETGERLTRETFEQRRKQGGPVVVFSMKEPDIERAVRHPGVIIASDGLLENGKGHPRSAGTYSRVLSHYVRDRQALTLMEALAKMTLLPAKRLESFTPAMKRKGRLQVGADADITVFDPAKVRDRATYEQPSLPPEGIPYVLVNGVLVVREGKAQEASPGQGIRAR